MLQQITNSNIVNNQNTLLQTIETQLETISSNLNSIFNEKTNLQVNTTNQDQFCLNKILLPELDNVNENLANSVDLESLIAYLGLKQDEKQSAIHKERINMLKGKLKSNHQNTIDKIQKSINEAIKAEDAAKAKKATNWLSAIFSVIVAVVLTVCTGGLAAGLAIAGAAIAVTSLIMDETGAAKKLCKLIADSLKNNNPNLSKNECNAIAQGIYGGIFLVLGLATSLGGIGASGGKALIDVGQTIAKVIKGVTNTSNTILNIGSMVTTGVSNAFNYNSGKAQADVTETESILRALQQALEHSEDELKSILQQLSETIEKMLEMLESKTDVLANITEKIALQV